MVFDPEGNLRVAGGKCNTRYVEMFSAHQLIVSKNAFSLIPAISSLYILVQIVSLTQLTTQLD